MVSKVEKILAKLSLAEKEKVLALREKITNLDLEELDIKPVKRQNGLYRLRVGKIRIIFAKRENKGIIIKIDYRDKVYK